MSFRRGIRQAFRKAIRKALPRQAFRKALRKVLLRQAFRNALRKALLRKAPLAKPSTALLTCQRAADIANVIANAHSYTRAPAVLKLSPASAP